MSESSERKIKNFTLWKYIDNFLVNNESILQSEIIEYAETHALGSKKTILQALQIFLSNKLLVEVELLSDNPGRPKKAYKRPNKIDNIPDIGLIDLKELPDPLYEYICQQSISSTRTKIDIANQLLIWAFNYLQSFSYDNSKPDFIHNYLNKSSNLQEIDFNELF